MNQESICQATCQPLLIDQAICPVLGGPRWETERGNVRVPAWEALSLQGRLREIFLSVGPAGAETAGQGGVGRRRISWKKEGLVRSREATSTYQASSCKPRSTGSRRQVCAVWLDGRASLAVPGSWARHELQCTVLLINKTAPEDCHYIGFYDWQLILNEC